MPHARRICIFSPYSGRGNISGTQVRLRMLAKHLSELGYEIDIIGPFSDVAGATVHHFSLDVPLWRRPIRSLLANRMIRQLDPNVVILEGPAFILGLTGIKIIQMIHDSKFATKHRRSGGWLIWIYYYVMCRIYAYTMTVSGAEKDRIAASLRLPKDRILVSYNGIGKSWIKPVTSQKKEFDLIYVSNFAKHKGHIRFLNSVAGQDYRIAFVGGDLGWLSRVKDFAYKKGLDVHFLHNLSEEDLIETYDRSRAFVFPSELEGFGIPFVEARARALPVIASDIEVFHELAGELGASIVDFNNSTCVKAAISEALDRGSHPTDISEFLWRKQAENLAKTLFGD